MSTEPIPKTTIIDYSFLAPVRNQSYFYLNRQKAAREHVRSKWSQDCWKLTPQQRFEEFQTTYRNRPPFDRERVQALHQCLNDAVERWTSFRSLFAEIQNEYALVMQSLVNSLDEKAFLQNKVQSLICKVATKEQLQDQRNVLTNLQLHQRHIAQVNDFQTKAIEKNEREFLAEVVRLYEVEMERLGKKKEGAKAKKDLLLLGKWQFLKDWISEKGRREPVMDALAKKLSAEAASFRTLISEEDELRTTDADSSETRKLKSHIESLKRGVQSHTAEIASLAKKEKSLDAQIRGLDVKISGIHDLIEAAKASNRQNSARASSGYGRQSKRPGGEHSRKSTAGSSRKSGQIVSQKSTHEHFVETPQ
ncbi:hypothetical protein HDV03_005207 [Kappamyces sp. JEL0829]|nr:hypothetical protein HDV03_005207 [Kappamyces sp. JEL0829]